MLQISYANIQSSTNHNLAGHSHCLVKTVQRCKHNNLYAMYTHILKKTHCNVYIYMCAYWILLIHMFTECSTQNGPSKALPELAGTVLYQPSPRVLLLGLARFRAIKPSATSWSSQRGTKTKPKPASSGKNRILIEHGNGTKSEIRWNVLFMNIIHVHLILVLCMMFWFMLDLFAAFAAYVSNKYGNPEVHIPTNN